MKNAFVFFPLLIVALQNIHSPAASWNEAATHPGWFKSYPPAGIEMQKDGMQQWKYAIDTWGSKGSRNWKKEANAFNGVCTWFPDDRLACAKARLGIVTIYLQSLSDYRRAIIEANNLLSEYPEQKEQCAFALVDKGWAYYLLRDFKNSRLAFTKVVNEFREYRDALEPAQKGIAGLDFLEKK
jgi:tetratricopeptide (TPR) repeat protein